MNAHEETRLSLTPFPRERIGEHSAIEHLRLVCRYSRIAACLLDDAHDSADNGDHDHAAFLEQVALESAELMMRVAEDALRALHDAKHARDELELAQVMGAAA